MSHLYEMTFPNGKRYIGITRRTPGERLRGHIAQSKKGNYAVSNALKKYGVDAVTLKTIVEIDEWELLCLAEQEAIDLYKTRAPNGYNLTAGGEGIPGHKHSPEVRERIAAKRALQVCQKGRQVSDAQRKNLSLKLTGRAIHNDESKKRIGEAARGNQHSKGYRHTEAAKLRIAAANRQKTYKRGRVQSEAERALRSDAMRARYASGYVGPNTGRPRSDEANRKASEAMLARFKSPAERIKRSVQLATYWARRRGDPMSVLGGQR
jgi:group I intron endonuclease